MGGLVPKRRINSARQIQEMRSRTRKPGVAQISAVKTGRIIGKIIGRAKGVNKSPHIVFLLVKPDPFSFPGAYGVGAMFGFKCF